MLYDFGGYLFSGSKEAQKKKKKKKTWMEEEGKWDQQGRQEC